MGQVTPSVTHGHRFLDFLMPHHQLSALNACSAVFKFLIFTGNVKAFGYILIKAQPARSFPLEIDIDLAIFNLVRRIIWPTPFNGLIGFMGILSLNAYWQI